MSFYTNILVAFYLAIHLVGASAYDFYGSSANQQDTYDDGLSYSYYHNSCGELEGIINVKVKEWVKQDKTLAPSLINLHFHDCAVRGCDASILLDHDGSEKCANTSKTLRGYELVDDIKAEVEKKCPQKVSCADILAGVARDATVEVGGPYWSVPYGRKDGRVSLAGEAEKIPNGKESITDLIEFFQSKGLNVLDLVTLSGMHTIGRSSCGSIQHRLYDFNGTGKPDPTISLYYLNYLRRKCRWASEWINHDAWTPQKFDNMYYKNLQKKMGLLSTDQMLYSDSRTSNLVSGMVYNPHVFKHRMAASMLKLGSIQEGDDDEGEVRAHCGRVNPTKY